MIVVYLILIIACNPQDAGLTQEAQDNFIAQHPKSVYYTVHITGEEMKVMSFTEIAFLLDIDSQELLDAVVLDTKLSGDYSIDSKLKDIGREKQYKPVRIKEIAERMKNS